MKGDGEDVTYLPMTVSSLAVAVEAVVGRRWRDSWRLLDTPLSLLKEELDLDSLWPLEKLLLDVSNRLPNMVTVCTVGGRTWSIMYTPQGETR